MEIIPTSNSRDKHMYFHVPVVEDQRPFVKLQNSVNHSWMKHFVTRNFLGKKVKVIEQKRKIAESFKTFRLQ